MTRQDPGIKSQDHAKTSEHTHEATCSRDEARPKDLPVVLLFRRRLNTEANDRIERTRSTRAVH